MSELGIYCKALSASELARKFAAIAAQTYSGQQLSVNVSTAVDGFSLSANFGADSIAEASDFQAFLACVEPFDFVGAAQGTLQPTQNSRKRITYTNENGAFGKLRIEAEGDRDFAQRALAAVRKHFPVGLYGTLAADMSSSIDQTAIALREQSVVDLQRTVESLAQAQAELAIAETANRSKLQAELNAAHASRLDELEKQYRLRQSELESQRVASEERIAAERRALDEKISQFEMQNSRVMRRELLKRMEAVLEKSESMSLSGGTARKRLWIHGTAVAMLIATGTLAGVMTYRVATADSPDWHFLIPLSASFLAFVATVVYYLKWHDRWFREHADAEFSAKRYKADIIRASWIAEFVHEWAKEGKGEMPQSLLAAFTRQLFRDPHSSAESEHPMEHLTAIMRRASEFNIGRGFFSVKAGPASGLGPSNPPSQSTP